MMNNVASDNPVKLLLNASQSFEYSKSNDIKMSLGIKTPRPASKPAKK